VPSFAVATCAPAPDYDEDRPELDAAAARAGLTLTWAVWDDPSVDWSAFDAVLVHSTWDYHDAHEQFVAWATHVDSVSVLHNPSSVVSWNAHKGYLLDLEAWGVAVIPTALVARDDPEGMSTLVDRLDWREVVVKPAVSAGAKATGRYRADDPAAERALTSVLADSDALVQPYLDEIEGSGETSLVVIDGEVTHAISKVPAAGDFRVQRHHGGTEQLVKPTDAELELASVSVDAASRVGSILYARVDCVTVDGQPTLMELEVIEPSLFLPLHPPAADVLIASFTERARARR
jgi:glutathione synthase/RimK-type ligase-like ATP-grasp enzyme